MNGPPCFTLRTAKDFAIKGADAAALLAAWTSTLGQALRDENVRLAAAPAITADALAPFGRGLIALDQHKPEQAATELASISTSPPSALARPSRSPA